MAATHVEPFASDLDRVYDALVVGTRDYVHKNGFTDVAIDRVYAECGSPNANVNDVIARLKEFRRTGNDALHMYLAE